MYIYDWFYVYVRKFVHGCARDLCLAAYISKDINDC